MSQADFEQAQMPENARSRCTVFWRKAATGYLANVDFMNESNSLAVRYKMVTIDQYHDRDRRGAQWAEPDIDHAAA